MNNKARTIVNVITGRKDYPVFISRDKYHLVENDEILDYLIQHGSIEDSSELCQVNTNDIHTDIEHLRIIDIKIVEI